MLLFSPMSSGNGVRTYILYAVTIFLSAFLLFQIQPIAGKLLLPWFGGSSSVWATSMLFFTSILFLGYLYAFLLTRESVRTQVRVHLSVTAFGALAASISLLAWGSIYPSLEWTIASALAPAAKTLLALISGIGIPYFLLSTTAPLLQYWYGISAQKEVYKLYAISNAGSLLALASYPFVVEPFARLGEQEIVWMTLFLLFVLLIAVVSLRIRKEGRAPQARAGSEALPVSLSHKLLSILYAALPAFVLLATTTEITQVIASLPLLWIVPLSLYLLSFIIAFTGFRLGSFVPLALGASAFAAWWYIDVTSYGIIWRLVADLVLLFFLALHAHSHLYRLRPSAERSPFFYLLISFGGVLGMLLAGIIAPLILNDYYEFPIGLALAAAVALHVSPQPWIFSRFPRYSYFVKIALIAFILTLIAYASYDFFKGRNEGYTLVSRNFYGTVKVYENDIYRSLLHGTTLHGIQLTERAREFAPISYYSPESGIGRAFMYSRLKDPDRALSVGVLGLGVGMTAAYCLPGDRFVYYEIDPRIEKIAREAFTYLSHCPQAEVRYGDGRIMLEQEFREGLPAQAGERGGYDIVLADAFNNDTIPVHLITREAIARYVSHLRDERSIVAVHISNRYLDLLPVLMSIAQEEGLSLLNVHLLNYQQFPSSASHWVLLSPSPATFNADIFKGAASPLSHKRVPAWTDDFSDLFSVIELP